MAASGFINRTYKHLSRYREIIGVLIKYGFEDVLATIRIRKHLPFLRRLSVRKKKREIQERTRWERMRLVLEELGTTFIKLGQIMSNRPDMLPPPLTDELAKLQDSVPAFPYKEVVDIVETELEVPIGNVFKSFDEDPVASASIAQVHNAVLKDGTKVAVKVQRPRLEQQVRTDLQIMQNIAYLMKRYMREMEMIDPEAIVRRFEETLLQELNFVTEAANMQRFAVNFKDDKTVYVPRVFKKYVTRKVLVMERVEGIKVSELDKLREVGLDTRKIAARGATLIFKQVFEHGFFHADPHPGNLMALDKHIICVLDFGQMGMLLDSDREQLGTMLIALQTRDVKSIIRALQKIALDQQIIKMKLLEYRLHAFIQEYSMQSLRDLKIDTLARQLRTIIFEHRIRVPPDFFLLLKSLTTIEGVGRKLDPDFNAFVHAEPFVKRIIKQRYSPSHLARKLYRWLLDAGTMVSELPFDAKAIIDKLKQGRLHIEVEHTGWEPFLLTLDRVSNRLVFSIVLAALIIGSSLIVLSGIPPTWHEVPVIGVLGYLIAGIMGLWLLITILRSGRM